ncbi:MAG: 2-amino-4-hydroxy-6-hydroxymethyldihydropteridine diphosphokinase, partial [Pontixanthobacter sp.]
MYDTRDVQYEYVIALGSNIRHPRHGPPRKVLAAAATRLESIGTILAVAPVIDSVPIGPSRRRYANGAVRLRSEREPGALLAALKRIERDFGRRAAGRWQSRVLDLDIILWSGGRYGSRALTIPHRAFRMRPFVTGPVAAIAPHWRDPDTGLS